MVFIHRTATARMRCSTCHSLSPLPAAATASHISPSPTPARYGVVRTNCIDCLDRTNVAQFCVGRTILPSSSPHFGFASSASGEALEVPPSHLHHSSTPTALTLAQLPFPFLSSGGEWSVDEVKAKKWVVTQLALQYGGSQAVGTPNSNAARDFLQSVKRFYRNTFTDLEKQHIMDVFLGVHQPTQGGFHIWELESDLHLHNRPPPHLVQPLYPKAFLEQEGGGMGMGGVGGGGGSVIGGGGEEEAEEAAARLAAKTAVETAGAAATAPAAGPAAAAAENENGSGGGDNPSALLAVKAAEAMAAAKAAEAGQQQPSPHAPHHRPSSLPLTTLTTPTTHTTPPTPSTPSTPTTLTTPLPLHSPQSLRGTEGIGSSANTTHQPL